MRQVSDVHEAVAAELFAAAGVEKDYAALPESRKLELLLAELRQPRLLTLPWHEYSEQTRNELAILATARELRARATASAWRATTSSRTRKRCPTWSRSCCCRRNPACCRARWAARPTRRAWS
ncbi:phosphoenolpyruvate carboxylase [Cupriavidus basilensis]